MSLWHITVACWTSEQTKLQIKGFSPDFHDLFLFFHFKRIFSRLILYSHWKALLPSNTNWGRREATIGTTSGERNPPKIHKQTLQKIYEHKFMSSSASDWTVTRMLSRTSSRRGNHMMTSISSDLKSANSTCWRLPAAMAAPFPRCSDSEAARVATDFDASTWFDDSDTCGKSGNANRSRWWYFPSVNRGFSLYGNSHAALCHRTVPHTPANRKVKSH